MRTPLSQQVDELYCTHHRWLNAWLRMRTGCPEQAADLTQDIFLRILAPSDAQARLSAVDNLRGYLVTIAKRLMIDHFRRGRLELAWLETLINMPEPESIPLDALMILLQDLQRLDTTLDGLAPRVKRTFLLSQLHGMTHKEIAEQLSVSVITVSRDIAVAVRHCLLAQE